MIRVIAGLLVRDGRLLICQRRGDAAFPLKWEFPGGKVEPGETDSQALRRELREELAIEIGDSKEVFQNFHRYTEGPDVELRFHQITGYTGELRNVVFQQILWVAAARLGEYEFLDGDRPVLLALLSRRLLL